MVALSKGNDLTPSNGVITVTHDVHRIVNPHPEETIIITTINSPDPDFNGYILLLGSIDGGALLQTGGNIASSVSLSGTRSQLIFYDKDENLWYPHS